jgi:hypothetical protein
MKNKKFCVCVAIAIAALVFSVALAGCNGGGGSESVTYSGTVSGSEYTLRITASKAAYTPVSGDSYRLTVTPAGGASKTSSGTIQSAGSTSFTLKPSNASVSFTITINSSGGITTISGTITFTDNTTATVGSSSGGTTTGGTTDGEYTVGSTGPAGGIIFYVNNSGFTANGATCHYMEAAPADLPGTYQWGGYGTTCSTGTAIGTGAANTAALAEHDHGTLMNKYGVGVHQAARACADYTYGGYSDWFLPSKAELAELELCKLLSFNGSIYWSSSEVANYDGNAWYQNFSDGVRSYTGKYYDLSVRAVRAF